MPTEKRPRDIILRIAPAVAAAVAMAVGTLALLGWRFGITELIRVQSGLAAMRPNAAAGFMLGGLSLWLLSAPGATGASRWIALTCAWVVTLLGGGTLAEDLLGLNLHIDGILYTSPVGLGEGRMAEMSATSFLLLGLSLLLLPRRNPLAIRVGVALGVAMGGAALLTLIGYLYEVDALYAVAWFRTEALHSAAVFLILALGVACVRPNAGIVRLLRSETSGGEVARRLLPAVVLLPVVLGRGVLRGEQLNGYSTGFALALYTLLIIGVLATLVWGSARALAEADEQRLAAEAALRAQEERAREDVRFFHSVLDSLPDGVLATDLGGRLTLWNVAAQPIIGLAPTGAPLSARLEAYGAVHRDGVTPVTPSEFPTTLALAGETVAGFEMLFRGANPPAWVAVSASPLRDRHRQMVGGVSVFRDVSERRALEGQLYASDRLASIGLLAAGVAHEINNPLAVVMGNLQLLARQHRGEGPATGMLTDAMAATDRVRRIVKNLQTLSRADSEKQVLVNVQEVVQSAVRVAWQGVGARARVVENYANVSAVSANEARLGQIVLNLMMNAAAALPESATHSGQVTVSTSMRGKHHVVIEVRDNGVGISAENRQRLFTPFFTTKSIGEGTGLGLSISHRLVADLGGEIEVESDLGFGSTFRVVLPAAEAPRPRVLVVDDEREIGSLIAAALRDSHEVMVCGGGAEALDLVQRDSRWDLLLVDINMPGMSGMELVRRLAESAPDLTGRIIFLTGGAFTHEAEALVRDTRHRVLDKPFDITTLRATVSGAVAIEGSPREPRPHPAT